MRTHSALLACAAVLAAGCGGGGSAPRGGSPYAWRDRPPQHKPKPKPLRLRRGEVHDAVRRLMEAPPAQVWQAEDELVQMGASVARNVRQALRSERGEVRAAAVRVLAEVLGLKAARDLVPMLEDEILDVRYHTICCLRRLTGEDFGYVHQDQPERRAQAVKRWREWLAGRRGPRRR